MVGVTGSGKAGFEPWPGTLCCVLEQYTLLSQRLSSPRCIKGTDEFNAGGNPGMDQHHIQGGGERVLVASCRTETRISSSLMGH